MMGALYGESVNAASPKLEALTDDAEILRQALECALQTPPGTFWSAPEYCYDLRALCNAELTAERLAMVPAEVEGALRLDERFKRVSVAGATTTTSGGGAALRLEIQIAPVTAGDLPLRYVAIATSEIVRLYTRGT